MLDGRYPSSEFGELRPRISWDRLAGTIRARKGAQKLAVVNAGTIPDRGLFMVTLRDRLADRGDRPRPRDRDAGAGRAGRCSVLEGRLGRSPEGARRGDRRLLAL